MHDLFRRTYCALPPQWPDWLFVAGFLVVLAAAFGSAHWRSAFFDYARFRSGSLKTAERRNAVRRVGLWAAAVMVAVGVFQLLQRLC